MEAKCQRCGESIPDAVRRNRRFCQACRDEKRRQNQRLPFRPTVVTCAQCGREKPVEARGVIPRYCSTACCQEAVKRRRRERTATRLADWSCRLCGAEQVVAHGCQRYCPGYCKERAAKIRSYGITVERYLEMAEAQGDRCAICGAGGDREYAIRRLCIDHCHETNEVRGLLCSPCNTGIGHLRDDPDLVRGALAYLLHAA